MTDTKACPKCLSMIPAAATRCPQCGGSLSVEPMTVLLVFAVIAAVFCGWFFFAHGWELVT